ncbi:nitroreductase family protein [Myxococcota bacterium]|nr:nitroreductase family protein [Myxococcota bacterium]
MSRLIINETSCIRCNTCAEGCVLGIIERAVAPAFPKIISEMEAFCLKCGHCEAFCPQEALVLDYLREEKIVCGTIDGVIEPRTLERYMKKRRSIRVFTDEHVPRETITGILDAARYAASGGNQQPVQWLVLSDPGEVRRVAGLTIDWMRSIIDTEHPLAPYAPFIIEKWDGGGDPICHGAPHLLFAHIPGTDGADDPTEAVIAMTHVDIAAPAFGVGTCWAGFVKMAADTYGPLQEVLTLPEGRRIGCAMMFGVPRHPVVSIPRRNPAVITWR